MVRRFSMNQKAVSLKLNQVETTGTYSFLVETELEQEETAGFYLIWIFG